MPFLKLSRSFVRSFLMGVLLISASALGADSELLRHGQSTRIDLKRLGLYHLTGTPFEVGEAAMRLAPPSSETNGTVPFMASFLENLIERQPFLLDHEPFSRLINPFLERKYYRKLRYKMPEEYRRLIRGMAAGSALNYRTIERAFMNPDVLYVAISDQMQGRLWPGGNSDPSPRTPLAGNLPLMCSSVLIPGKFAADGKLIFGRVQDYPTMDAFDRYPSVFYIAKTGKYRYLSVASAGIAVGGITVMNEHGLTLSMHTGATYDAAPARVPGLVTTNEMIEGARTIEEAVQICNQNLPAAGWLINVADTSTRGGRVGWIEVNPQGRCELTLSEKPLVTTNHYRHPERRLREISLGASVDQSSADRLRRLKQLVAKQRRAFRPQDVMRILADKMDLTLGRPLAYGPSAIAALDQIVAVVFRPETREIYVSNGRSPTALQGEYVRLRFSDFEDLAGISEQSRAGDIDISNLLKGTNSDLRKWPAYSHYKAAHLALNLYAENIDTAAAIRHLNAAVESEPNEITLRWSRALVRMQRGELEQAQVDLDAVIAAKAQGLDDHRLKAAHLQRGKVLDALDDRRGALTEYRFVIENTGVADPLHVAAEHFLGAAVKTKDLSRFYPDLKFMDTLGYE